MPYLTVEVGVWFTVFQDTASLFEFPLASCPAKATWTCAGIFVAKLRQEQKATKARIASFIVIDCDAASAAAKWCQPVVPYLTHLLNSGSSMLKRSPTFVRVVDFV